MLHNVSSAVYLIDFDNVRPDIGVPYRNRDTAQAADFVRRQVLQHAASSAGITDVRLRYYGGWYLKRGDSTYDCRDLVRWIPRAPKRDGVMRVVIELASSLLAYPALDFYGTLRLPGVQTAAASCSSPCSLHCAPRPQQKMVDMMLGLDLVRLTSVEPVHAVLYSSDEDLYPAVLEASHGNGRATKITWLRPGRPSGNSPNDTHVASTALEIRELP